MWEESINSYWGKCLDIYLMCRVLITILIHFLFSQVLCKSHPVEFASYFHYCHSLTFDQRPDYGFLKRLFRDLFTREGDYFDDFLSNMESNYLQNCVYIPLNMEVIIIITKTWDSTYCLVCQKKGSEFFKIKFMFKCGDSSNICLCFRIYIYVIFLFYFSLLVYAGYEFDYVFDWTILKYKQAQKNRVQPHISVSIFPLHE